MRQRLITLKYALLRKLQERFGYQQTTAYGIFPPSMKTTFRRDQL